MKNFKFIIVTCLILSMLAMLIACGDNDTADTAVSSDTSGEASVTESSDSTESSESTNVSGAPVFDGNADDIIYDIF